MEKGHTDNNIINQLTKAFQTLFSSEPHLFRSPGRINLIGEHVDYNQGIVFPGAIDKYIYLAFQNRNDDQIHLYSLNYNQLFKISLSQIHKTETHWANYILGVVQQFQQKGARLTGFNLAFTGDIPIGAGLSSSAALECATAFAIQEANGLSIEKMDLAKLAQAAENKFVGVNCGLMDQFASVFGRKNYLIQFDCRSLEYTYVPFRSLDYTFVLFDTQVHHSLADSAYNERREQCEKGLSILRQYYPQAKSLRDISQELMDRHLKTEEPILHQRCRFIIQEISRVQQAAHALNENDLETLGQLMFQSHEGLSKDYEVSCPELDFLINEAKSYTEILGARMMGGGFGGCTINLIRKDRQAEICEQIKNAYTKKWGVDMKNYQVNLVDGTERLSVL